MRYRRKIKQPRYRIIDGKASVELKLKTPRQLFDERDPAPFRERDLDDDAARYILTSYLDLKHNKNVQLSLYFESLGELQDKPQVIENAIRAFFEFESEAKRRELREILRVGGKSLFIGLTFLFICTFFAHQMSAKDAPIWQSMMHEGLVIAAYCTMWKPLSIFLYDWWPIREDMMILRKLSQIDIGIFPLEEKTTAGQPVRDIGSSRSLERETTGTGIRPLRDLKTTSTF